jgi:hypothetical protein
LVEEIMSILHAMLPRKVLGVTVQKDPRDPTPLIKALASTPSPAAQQLLRDTAAKHPDQPFGRAAARILRDIEADSGNQAEGRGRILGDLQLFGLPDILRRLAGSRAAGTLTLRDIAGKTMGILTFSDGRLVGCVSENLSATSALHLLFEKPKAGTFLFSPSSSQEAAEAADAAMPRELEPLIVEGMRRYDEYQWVRAVVPDTPALRATGSEPDFAQADEEPALCREVWHKTSSGLPPIEIEKSVAVDPLRIRRILARWLEEGTLA